MRRFCLASLCAVACTRGSERPITDGTETEHDEAAATDASDAGADPTVTTGAAASSSASAGDSATSEPDESTGASATAGDTGQVVDEADAFGIAKIYGDLAVPCLEPECVRHAGLGGRDIHLDVENLPSYDGEGEHPLVELGDDVWGVALDWSGTEQMQARLELWSVDDDPWLTIEVTAFVKVVANHGDAAIQPYVYGGRHTSNSDAHRCYGGAYKPKFRLSGAVTVQKELCHSDYSASYGQIDDAWAFEEGRWYGFKSVAYPVDDGVRIEMYLLQNELGQGLAPALAAPEDQHWVLITTATDTGWTIGSSFCETTCGTVDGTIFVDGNPVDEQESGSGIWHSDANVAALRLDDVIAHIWGVSVRRIEPSAPLR